MNDTIFGILVILTIVLLTPIFFIIAFVKVVLDYIFHWRHIE